MGEEDNYLVDEIEATVRQAADGSRVAVIRLEIGKAVTVPKTSMAAELHVRFPGASIEMKDGKRADSVIVKDIEVE